MRDSARPKLILGTAQFGQVYGVTNPNKALELAAVKSLVHFAVDSGVDTFDTAVSYGTSEALLGTSLQDAGLSHPRIITKVKFPESGDLESWLERSLLASMARLKVYQLDGLLLHNVADLSRPEVWRALSWAKERGWTDKIGVSPYEPGELAQCPLPELIDLIQIPFNLLDHRWDSSAWLSHFKGRKPEVHVRSLYLQGLLLGETEQWPARIRKFAPSVGEFILSCCDQLQCSPVELSLNFAKNIDWIDGLVIGSYDLEQLKETVGGFRKKIIDSEAMSLIRETRPNLPNEVLDPRSWA